MKGIYLLLINLNKDIKIKVGSLGNLNFRKGGYIYVGSAQNNLRSRINRHARKIKKKFWHIDYLISNKNAEVADVFYKEAGKKEECKTAKELSRLFIPVQNFGCSDCTCCSHLLFITKFYKPFQDYLSNKKFVKNER
ncbi:MAG: GIY-YIG nuclease family protein [Candidatus Woesearchaeota archaeon]|nr:MAG: GIY-YIG nuclease family protein [Candidatus Woesearchaeota archaeon]